MAGIVLMTAESPRSTDKAGVAAFQETLWSRIFAASSADSGEARAALDILCRRYWYPIYAFLRRWGHDRERAKDLTQAFFAFMLEKDLFGAADPEKGRFRAFLLKSLRNFVHKERAKEMTIKRGGDIQLVSIDEEAAEDQYKVEPFTDLTPDKLFERRWALLVIEEALRRLESEYRKSGMQTQFDCVRPYLTGEDETGFVDLGARIGKTEGAARVVVFRCRNRFREFIRDVVSETVHDPAEIESEVTHLQEALRA